MTSSRRRRKFLEVGAVYEVPGEGPCEVVLVNDCRARMQPLVTHPVTVPADATAGRVERTFEARGRAFDVSPTAPLRRVSRD